VICCMSGHQTGKVRRAGSCSRPSYHSFASDSSPPITRSRVSHLFNDHGRRLDGDRSLTERTSKATGVSARPNGSAHLGRPLRWRHQEYFRSAESSYGKRDGRDRPKDGTSRDRARQTQADRKMDAFDYYLQGMPQTRQATRQACDDALFIWACATRVICSPAAAASTIMTKDHLTKRQSRASDRP
jgi:hypothetical protein